MRTLDTFDFADFRNVHFDSDVEVWVFYYRDSLYYIPLRIAYIDTNVNAEGRY